jgi:hypothetical protein
MEMMGFTENRIPEKLMFNHIVICPPIRIMPFSGINLPFSERPIS